MKNSSTSKREVEFFGETYTIDGQKPAKGKEQAIVEMPAPSCKKEVQSFIRMINYLSKFSARLSELALPIRELAKDKVAFNWGPEHQAAFKLVKKEIAASKVLTEAQCGYVAIELESLAVAWAMEKFHHFLYGSHFLLETDQKPLETVLSRSLNQATCRLQRILIRTFPYNFSVHYLPGLKNQLVDCLSRVGGLQDSIKLPKLSVYQITSQLNARSAILQQLHEASQADDTLVIFNTQYRRGGQAT